MAKNLVIVESPAKAKTIEKFLGSEFTVKSSYGHIRDLPSKGLGVDIENQFEPTYEVSTDKLKVVSELKKAAKQAETIWLASDEDREGEAIAWHLAQALALDANNTKRIVFHEITKNAILAAIENPRSVDNDLVNAQQARRILDRLVGFELSPVLWKKVKPSLSAGRVQSVAVRLIVDREREIINFKAEGYYRVTAAFDFTDKKGKSYKLKAELSYRFPTKEEAIAFLTKLVGADYIVEGVEVKPAKRTPAAPFTTSTLQQEASRKLGFSVSQTMSTAQRLYEAGLITYMRTDSVNLSGEAMAAIKGVVESKYGTEAYKARKYKNKNKSAQEAHEAIRPSYIQNDTVDVAPQERKLYELIWKRTVASQMADAILERTTINIGAGTTGYNFVAKGEVIIKEGFLALYSESSDNDDSSEYGLIAPISQGDMLQPEKIDATERWSQKPARYSEAALVKKLEELGIGRPSTYAPTISTVINRGYVVKEDREGVKREYTALSLVGGEISENLLSEITGSERNKLFPTDIGMIVTDYLSAQFPTILDYNFTANVEQGFDTIAEGNLSWQKMISDFYAPFHKLVTDAESQNTGYAAQQSLRHLGVDPTSGKNVYVRMGRFGPLAQLGESGEEDKTPQYASLRRGQLIETITLEEAIKLFDLPRNLGPYEEKDVTVSIGRFGPYIRHDSKFVSLEKTDSPYTIDFTRAVELIEKKRQVERERIIKVFEEDDKLELLNGRYGAYIAYDGGNYKLPKGCEPKELDYAACMEIIKSQPEPKKRVVKKAAAKKAPAKKAPAKKAAAKKTAAKKA